ncbi:MAG: aromatic/alkene monooxygenase hydroxylase subunit beta [Sneathiellaceae bacterium]
MSEQPDLTRPLKTWSHLAKNRRRPSEYEIVSTNLLWSTDDPMPWALSPDIDMNKWYLKYRNGSPLAHDDWDAFRDPDELVYRSYNILQDGQETYVDGLLEEHARNGHDAGLSAEWVAALARLYTPARYPVHCLQMSSAYLVQMVPASTIENCVMFQAADQLRWLSRTAYRTKELANSHPQAGFATGERALWERDPCWQGFRELLERLLVAYDWAEQFVALDIVAKPAFDEAVLRQLGRSARRNGDSLLAQLLDAQWQDSARARRWTRALVDFARGRDGNDAVLSGWVAKWAPLGDAAIAAYCAGLPDNPEAAEAAVDAARDFRATLGFSA